jgi:hypothetical protein
MTEAELRPLAQMNGRKQRAAVERLLGLGMMTCIGMPGVLSFWMTWPLKQRGGLQVSAGF